MPNNSSMLKFLRFTIILSLMLGLVGCWMAPNPIDGSITSTDDSSVLLAGSLRETGAFNDFITSVYQAPAAEKQALVDSFIQWADSLTGIPYIEDSTAYFLYLNTANAEVKVAGDFTGWTPETNNFSRLTGTSLYYRSLTFENDARLDYKLVMGGNWFLDPLNSNTCSGGYGPNSELSMLGYVQPPEIQVHDIPHGDLTTHSFSDTTQGRTRTVRIYTPPGYEESELSYRAMYFLDGSEYVSLGYAANTLDYLIAQGEIPPIIGVFTDPTNRMEEYAYDYNFLEMFVNELIPWTEDQYRCMDGPENRAITGVSLGGLSALLFTIQHPEVFGNCGAYSSAIYFGDLIDQYEAQDVLPVKIYMDAGTYEPSIYNSSLSLVEILEDNGWDHVWEVWHEGHSWGAWRAHLDNSLTYFWPMNSTGIDDRF